MRNLAGRSADAAKEIRDLIDGSGREIENGAELVRRAEAAIESVVTSVIRVNDIMGDISAASEEQSTGINQINQAVAQMDGVCLLYTSPSPRDKRQSRMPSSA